MTTSVTLSHLDGRKWTWTHFGAGGSARDAWTWIAEQIAAEFECHEDDVGADELPDGREVVTVRGEPVMVYRLSRESQTSSVYVASMLDGGIVPFLS